MAEDERGQRGDDDGDGDGDEETTSRESGRGEREEACGGRLDAFTDDFARRFMGRPKASNPISCQRTVYRWDEVLSHDN